MLCIYIYIYIYIAELNFSINPRYMCYFNTVCSPGIISYITLYAHNVFTAIRVIYIYI